MEMEVDVVEISIPTMLVNASLLSKNRSSR